MAALIPPLDFSRSPSSFRTAAESPTDEHGDDHSVASTPTPAPREAFNSPDDEATEWSEAADEVPELGDSAEHKRRCSIRSQHSGKMLVKRNKSQKLQKRLSSTSEQAPRSYRCDIHATSSTDYNSAEAECKQLILEAGGSLIDDFCYPGGFLYSLTASTLSLIQDGDETEGGGHISVEAWKPFPCPLFNPLRLKPYGGADELLLPMRRKTIAAPERLWSRCDGSEKKRVSMWLGHLVRDYGRGVSYIA